MNREPQAIMKPATPIQYKKKLYSGNGSPWTSSKGNRNLMANGMSMKAETKKMGRL